MGKPPPVDRDWVHRSLGLAGETPAPPSLPNMGYPHLGTAPRSQGTRRPRVEIRGSDLYDDSFLRGGRSAPDPLDRLRWLVGGRLVRGRLVRDRLVRGRLVHGRLVGGGL